jgi:hypothetical protein
MRALHKILLNLVIAVTFFILFYVFKTSESSSDGHYTSTFDNSCYTCTDSNNVFETTQDDSHGGPTTLEAAAPFETKSEAANDVYNVWCIFTKAISHASMKRKFHTFTNSLFKHSTGQVALHIIIDNSSKPVAEDVLETVKEATQKNILVWRYVGCTRVRLDGS